MQTKTNYTQEMVDNNVRCEAGMECMVQITVGAEPEKCQLLGWYNKEVWVLLYDGMCTTVVKSDQKVIFPIPEPTCREIFAARVYELLVGTSRLTTHECEEIQDYILVAVDEYDKNYIPF